LNGLRVRALLNAAVITIRSLRVTLLYTTVSSMSLITPKRALLEGTSTRAVAVERTG